HCISSAPPPKSNKTRSNGPGTTAPLDSVFRTATTVVPQPALGWSQTVRSHTSGGTLLGQPRFPQPLKVMFVVLRELKCDGPLRDSSYRIIWYQAHDPGRLRPSLLELAQLRVDCS